VFILQCGRHGLTAKVVIDALADAEDYSQPHVADCNTQSMADSAGCRSRYASNHLTGAHRQRSGRKWGVVARLQLMTVRLELRSKRRKLAASRWIHMTLPARLTGLLCVCRRCCGLSGRENHYRGSEKQSGNRRSENRSRLQAIHDMVH